jgi:dienelactone hydrolase
MMRYWICALLALVLTGTTEAKMRTESPTYTSGGVTMRGYLAWDDGVKGKRPAVLVVHDWMGEGPFSRQKAEALAKLGYIGFAVDVYGEGVRPANAGEAAKAAGALKADRSLLRARMKAGLDYLLGNPLVDSKRVGVIGFCFGGTSALELARSGADVAGVVSFHGSLDTPAPADAKNIKGKVLVLHGADDPGVPLKQVLDFNDEMKQAGVDYQIVLYGHAVHAFTNPAAGTDNSRGAAYNEKADRRSWEAMKDFFNEVFKAGK